MTGSKRPQVFHLITRLLKGGAEAKTIATVRGLTDYEFTVGYGAEYDQEQVCLLEEDGVRTKRFPLIRHYNPVTSVPAVMHLAWYLRREGFNIVHTHSTEAGIIGRLAAAIAEVPHIVHTVHGVPFTEDRADLLNWFVQVCERQAAKFTDKIVTNASAITEEYLKRGIGDIEQYTTIYSGIELTSFRDAEPAESLPGFRPRVVMIGRLVEGKGFNVMLDAAELVCDGHVSVCIVGEGPLSDSIIKEISQRELSDSVFLAGYRDAIPNVLAASDILVLPSFREGTPRVISEAMASSLPVIGTNIAGIPEQVVDGETGSLITPGDHHSLADKIEELLADPDLRAKMGNQARKRAHRFSVSRMIEDIDDLYANLLESRTKKL